MPTLVKPDQMGFTKIRQTTDATRRIISIIRYIIDRYIIDIGKELHRLANFKLSWAGRIYKMVILPKILYVFRTLTIPIKPNLLCALSVQFKKLIWQRKRARCSHMHLIRHRKYGDLGMVDIADYYLASLLAQSKN